MGAGTKRLIVAAAIAALEEQVRFLTGIAEETRAAAVHEESRPENDKDTRGLEASYLARGQAARVEELLEATQRLRFLELPATGEDVAVSLGRVVTLESEDSAQRYFITPVAGGLKVTVAGETFQLLTPAAPLGRALVEKRSGDEVELRIAGKLRVYEIVGVE